MLRRQGTPSESYVIVSDVHLGSDIHNQAEQGFGVRSKQVDLDFESFIRHYRTRKPNADRWRLIIAGDFIDFIGMVIAPEVSGEISIQRSTTMKNGPMV